MKTHTEVVKEFTPESKKECAKIECAKCTLRMDYVEIHPACIPHTEGYKFKCFDPERCLRWGNDYLVKRLGGRPVVNFGGGRVLLQRVDSEKKKNKGKPKNETGR